MTREQEIEFVEDRIHHDLYGSQTDHMSYHSCACNHEALTLLAVRDILNVANGKETDLEDLVESYLDSRNQQIRAGLRSNG